MKRRKLNKNRVLLVIGCAVVAVIAILGIIRLLNPGEKITFYIDGKAMKEQTIQVEYGTEFSFAPADLKLTAKDKSDADLTSRITFQAIELTELKEYEVPYRIIDDEEEYQFLLKIKVQDTSGPQIDGPDEIEWELGKEFNTAPAEHGISAYDAVDGDVSEKIEVEGTVDATTEGTYEITYSVKDHAGNESKHILQVQVKEAAQMVNAQDMMYADPRTITPAIVSPDSMTVLVNKRNAIPDGWEPDDLVSITSNNGRDMYLRREAAAAWEDLNRAAQAQGIQIFVVSSFRTASYQESLFNNYYAFDGANAFLYSALPRRSEHELGLAIDVSNDAQLHEDLLDTTVGQFMNNEGYKYGFILRYPKDKEAITGYGFEAWHYRYVGKQLAGELKQRGIVLEEYYK